MALFSIKIWRNFQLVTTRKVEERSFSEPEKRSFFVIFAGDCEDDWDEKRITGNYEKKTDI